MKPLQLSWQTGLNLSIHSFLADVFISFSAYYSFLLEYVLHAFSLLHVCFCTLLKKHFTSAEVRMSVIMQVLLMMMMMCVCVCVCVLVCSMSASVAHTADHSQSSAVSR